MLKLQPTSIKEAMKFVGRHHRHNAAPNGGLFAVGVEEDGALCGVAIVARPVARKLDNGFTAEVTRCCTTGSKNACSMLYGAAARAAKALGYKKIISYIMEIESGTSLKAAGWAIDKTNCGGVSWDVPTRPRQTHDLFGPIKRPMGKKTRWKRDLAA